ncbi:MAG: phosphotransferase [Micromonosporaceae bacterium]|nr:phosphotransferase [Micromonosporaceae bacterium]
MGVCADQVIEHLESTHGVSITGLTALDRQVFRVDRRDGPAWVARVFPPQRPVDAVEGDAAILNRLAEAGFPAERCAAPVSTMDGQGVLVTQFVEGVPPGPGGRLFAVLGALLGGLHARPASRMRPGGAWHHLAPTGGPAEEIDAALALLQSARSRIGGTQSDEWTVLLDAVAGLDDAADLPHGFVHPDFVPANVVETAGGDLVIVDWAGAGRGPRLWSLAYLLFVAGIRDLRLVDAVATRYRRHVQPTAGELERLAGAMRARPLLLDCWSVGAGRRTPAEAVHRLRRAAPLADRIAARAISAFTGT